MKIATSMLDPGLYSDAYSDEPYLYGPALSGLFTLNIGEKTDEVSAEDQLAQLSQHTGGVVEEGGTGSGLNVRKHHQIPSKWKKRRKHFLDAKALANFTFEKGRMYHADFFNPHLDFANFSLRLPGFSISVAKYIDEKTHHLRYVLKNRATNEVLFVVFFKLLFGEELERTLKAKRGEKEEVERREKAQVESNDSMAKREGVRQAEPVRNEGTPQVQSEEKTLQPTPRVADDEEDESQSSYSATAAVTSLSNNIYAAFVAMGLWDEASSSSGSDAASREPSPPASGRSLEAQVDDMSEATVEKYLQSRHGNTQ
jgi:hypothetical protein